MRHNSPARHHERGAVRLGSANDLVTLERGESAIRLVGRQDDLPVVVRGCRLVHGTAEDGGVRAELRFVAENADLGHARDRRSHTTAGAPQFPAQPVGWPTSYSPSSVLTTILTFLSLPPTWTLHSNEVLGLTSFSPLQVAAPTSEILYSSFRIWTMPFCTAVLSKIFFLKNAGDTNPVNSTPPTSSTTTTAATQMAAHDFFFGGTGAP